MSGSLVVDVRLKRAEFLLDVSLELEGVSVVMGPNGSGKTTLLQVLVGALRPSAGRIVVHGRVLFDSERRVDRPPEERHVAYVPRGFGLFPHLSVLENVVFGARAESPNRRRQKALHHLEELDAVRFCDRLPKELSAGEQQRVALARAIASDPDLILLDEPLSALDPTARPRVRKFLGHWLFESGMLAVIASHDAADAREYADELVILERGSVIQSGTPDEIAFRPASEFAANLTASLVERDPRSVRPPSFVTEDE